MQDTKRIPRPVLAVNSQLTAGPRNSYSLGNIAKRNAHASLKSILGLSKYSNLLFSGFCTSQPYINAVCNRETWHSETNSVGRLSLCQKFYNDIFLTLVLDTGMIYTINRSRLDRQRLFFVPYS